MAVTNTLACNIAISVKAIKGFVALHPRGGLLQNFCPNLSKLVEFLSFPNSLFLKIFEGGPAPFSQRVGSPLIPSGEETGQENYMSKGLSELLTSKTNFQ